MKSELLPVPFLISCQLYHRIMITMILIELRPLLLCAFALGFSPPQVRPKQVTGVDLTCLQRQPRYREDPCGFVRVFGYGLGFGTSG